MAADSLVAGRRVPTVLVVEDEYLIAEAVAAVLTDSGLNVVLASSGDQALSYIKAGLAVSLVFSGINMSGSRDGLELARQIAARDPQMPVILTSADEIGLTELGGFFFIQKPYAYAAVVRAVLAGLGLEEQGCLTR